MIQQLNYLNPITNNIETLNIDICSLNELYWYYYESFYNSEENLLEQINKSIIDLHPKFYKEAIYFGTDSTSYKDSLALIFRLLYRISDYILYNTIVEQIAKIHSDNIADEHEFLLSIKPKSKQRKMKDGAKRPKNIIKNEFVRHETEDMFTGKKTYLYENLKTGNRIESEDPNLLETLNAPKPKVKKEKTVKVKFVQKIDMSQVKFKFNK